MKSVICDVAAWVLFFTSIFLGYLGNESEGALIMGAACFYKLESWEEKR